MAQSRSSIIERNEAVIQLQEQEADIQQRISQAILTATKKKDNTIRLLQGALEASQKILNVIADILYQASEVFKRAVDAIIHFGTEQYKSIFSPSEAADIKSVMQEYGETTEMQKAIGDWLCGYTEHRQPFDEIKHRHTLKEVGDVAEGAYDWKIERMQENGIKMWRTLMSDTYLTILAIMFLLFNTLIVGYQNFLLCEKPRKRNNELKDMV